MPIYVVHIEQSFFKSLPLNDATNSFGKVVKRVNLYLELGTFSK